MTALARSTFYYKSHPNLAQAACDAILSERMQALALIFPRYGYRRMTAQLGREGFQVNHKRVLRLMRQANAARVERNSASPALLTRRMACHCTRT
jgi:transposase InsO family protein